MLDLIKSQALSASRLYKRVVRHYCLEKLGEIKDTEKNAILMKYVNIDEEDLMLDFKLNPHKEVDSTLFQLITQSRKPELRKNEEG